MSRRAVFFLILLLLTTSIAINAQNESDTPVVVGSFQSEIGCNSDWQPDCTLTMMEDASGVFSYLATLPAGEWSAKVTLGPRWDTNFGADGVEGGPEIAFVVEEDGTEVTFGFDPQSSLLEITIGEVTGELPDLPVENPTQIDNPDNVSIPGSFNDVIGCAEDWQPDCEQAQLAYDPVDDIWFGSFALPAGEYEYKVAINNSWAENYGGSADADGPNVVLIVAEDSTVDFYYDHKTNWIADSVNHIIANVPGSFQSEDGCPGDWQPDCLRTWLQDPDGDGTYQYATTNLPAGGYEAKVALNQSWSLNYGANGARDGANIPFSVLEENTVTEFLFDTTTNIMTITVGGVDTSQIVGNLFNATAHWVREDMILWDIPRIPGAVYRLHYAEAGGLQLGDNVIEGGESIVIEYDREGVTDEIVAAFPHLKDYFALKINADDLSLVPSLLRGQLAVSSTDNQGNLLDATSIQIPGVLDDLYTYDGDLGVVVNEGVPTLHVWAPTAHSVTLHLFEDANPETESATYDMTFDAESGVWSINGEAGWLNQYYLYEVEVYVPSTGLIERNLVTDPYSFSLSMNSARSQIVDLTDPAFMPEGWEALAKPVLAAPEDIVIYELHIRDFSILDATVTPEYRGTFMAFTEADSDGMNHLRSLAQVGLTHIHLLPTFDIATINENASERVEPDLAVLASFPPDSTEQQALIEPIRDLDGFNWGYDPYHYTVPEGSYATDPDGPTRILEFRQMVQALNTNDLHVVMDVVYNHTNAAGQSERSVLDRIVPGYYHRLITDTGAVATSTCCPNTATEHNMMRKLMIDSVITWATAYKVDGFRFDLMGHHMLDDMVAVREALNALTIETDGVDGRQVYVYGEGWNFGEVADNIRGVNATQLNIGGTGIGVFNDRLRDAVRGGNPFGGEQEQGFINGLYDDPNGITPGDEDAQRERLLLFMDQIRVGLAGNLADYSFTDRNGETVTGADMLYNGSPVGYTADPQENIVYISAHDNETLFDAIQYKAPADATIDDRVRMNNMGLSIVALTQGIPFFHAGDDMLRSKSLDRNSYNSGDWFNRLDFSYQTNNWGMGLPPAGDNESNWLIMQPLLATPELVASPDAIQRSVAHLQEMLAIRRSSPLFRLQTADEIISQVKFLNTGPSQIPGVIVMQIVDTNDIDPQYSEILVVFNATVQEQAIVIDSLIGTNLTLHPIQTNASDPVVRSTSVVADTGTLYVPARTTAVFVLPH